jgi:tetratricopeptide (TPR) repeat protein
MAQQQYESDRADFTAAVQLFQDAGDDQGIALVTSQIAFLDRYSGWLEDAARCTEPALVIFRSTGDQAAVANGLRNLAHVKMELRQLGAATELLAEAPRLAQAVGSRRAEAQVRYLMGEVCLLAGEPTRAVATFEQALARVRELKDPVGEAHVLRGLGVAKTRLGELGQARNALQRSLEIAGTVSERLAGARALLGLGELALASGDPGAGRRPGAASGRRLPGPGSTAGRGADAHPAR